MPHGGTDRIVFSDAMRELLKTNDAVLIGYVEALLRSAGIAAVVLDGHMSVLEGSVGILPRRVLVETADWEAAARVLDGADLGQWVSRDG